MEAHDTDFLDLLDGNKQFAVPIFQRRYSWEKKHCQRLEKALKIWIYPDN